MSLTNRHLINIKFSALLLFKKENIIYIKVKR